MSAENKRITAHKRLSNWPVVDVCEAHNPHALTFYACRSSIITTLTNVIPQSIVYLASRSLFFSEHDNTFSSRFSCQIGASVIKKNHPNQMCASSHWPVFAFTSKYVQFNGCLIVCIECSLDRVMRNAFLKEHRNAEDKFLSWEKTRKCWAHFSSFWKNIGKSGNRQSWWRKAHCYRFTTRTVSTILAQHSFHVKLHLVKLGLWGLCAQPLP